MEWGGSREGPLAPQYKIINKILTYICSWSPFTYNGNPLHPLKESRPLFVDYVMSVLQHNKVTTFKNELAVVCIIKELNKHFFPLVSHLNVSG